MNLDRARFTASCTKPGCKRTIMLPRKGPWLCQIHMRIARLQKQNEDRKQAERTVRIKARLRSLGKDV